VPGGLQYAPLGGITDSWVVFLIAVVVLLAAAYHTGDIHR
jgi:hypothetical protein